MSETRNPPAVITALQVIGVLLVGKDVVLKARAVVSVVPHRVGKTII